MDLHGISIIVPVHNGSNTISSCLNSIIDCEISLPKEIIVVDDGSTDGTDEAVRALACQYIKIEKSGVAKARNVGIEKASGDILFFFDADVKLRKDTMKNFLSHFEEDEDAYIIQGRWDKGSSSPSFSSRFLLLKYHYNFEGLFDTKNRLAVAHLATGCLGIRKDVFKDFKGFDEGYKRAGGEEHEFGMRLLKKYKIYYYGDIFVEHTFPDIIQNAKKVYFRTANFSMLVFNNNDRRFLKLHRTTVSIEDRRSIFITLLILLSPAASIFNQKFGAILFLCLVSIYSYNIRKFLAYLAKEEGYVFAIKGAMSHFIIMLPRLLGLLKAVLFYYILRARDYRV